MAHLCFHSFSKLGIFKATFSPHSCPKHKNGSVVFLIYVSAFISFFFNLKIQLTSVTLI